MLYVITLAGTIFMSRLLSPLEYGLFGMLTVFSNLASVVVGMGLAQAVVQNQSLLEKDLSSIFWINFILGFSVNILFFFSAPAIASFYGQRDLIEVTRVMSFLFLFYGCSAVPLGLLSKRLDFKELVISQLFAALISYGTGIVLAYSGYGVWSLVAQSIVNHFTYLVVNLYFSKWWPSFYFRKESIAKIGKFSRNFLPSQILDFFAMNLDVLLIGKYTGKTDLGLYGRSQALVQLPVNSIGLIFNKTFFSAFALLQNKHDVLSNNYLRAVKFLSISLMPILILTAIGADQIILFLFGKQWVSMSSLVSWLAISSAISAYNSFNDTVMTSQGRTDLLLRINVFEKIVLMVCVLVGMRYGVIGVALAKIISNLCTFIPKLLFLSKVIKISIKEWFFAQRNIFMAMVVCGAVAYIVKNTSSLLIVDIMLMTGAGLGSGLFFLILVREEAILDLMNIIKKAILFKKPTKS